MTERAYNDSGDDRTGQQPRAGRKRLDSRVESATQHRRPLAVRAAQQRRVCAHIDDRLTPSGPSWKRQDARRGTTHNVHSMIRSTPARARRIAAQVRRPIAASRPGVSDTVGDRVMSYSFTRSARHSSPDLWRGPERSRPGLSSGVPARGHRSEVPYASGWSCRIGRTIWATLALAGASAIAEGQVDASDVASRRVGVSGYPGGGQRRRSMVGGVQVPSKTGAWAQ